MISISTSCRRVRPWIPTYKLMEKFTYMYLLSDYRLKSYHLVTRRVQEQLFEQYVGFQACRITFGTGKFIKIYVTVNYALQLTGWLNYHPTNFTVNLFLFFNFCRTSFLKSGNSFLKSGNRNCKCSDCSASSFLVFPCCASYNSSWCCICC